MTESTIIKQGAIKPLAVAVADVVEALLSSKHKQSTRYTYSQNIKYFADYLLNGKSGKGKRIRLAEGEVKATIKQFLGMGKVEATAYLLQYQSDLIASGYVPNTINVRIASIRSLVKFAQKRGFCEWLVEDLDSVGNEVYRDTSGISKEDYSTILSGILTDTIQGKRDKAIMLLLWSNGLRRSELTGLNISDFDSEARTLMIKGKGKIQREKIFINDKVATAIKEWLAVRYNPTNEQPLFTSLANNSNGKRLSSTSVYTIVRKYADSVLTDKILSPHRIRHSSITTILNETNGNIRMAQRFSRHKNLEVLSRYDDNRIALQKEATHILGELI